MTNLPHKPKKSLGQNFLTDKNIIREIVNAAELKPGDTVLEIGAGRGELTGDIARICDVVAVELDRDLVPLLKEKFKDNEKVRIIEKDIMDADFNEILPSGKRVKVIGNIPYYITTPVIFKLLDSRQYFESIVLTVQKEIAERIVSNEKGKDYSILSIMVQYHSVPKIIRIVSKGSFNPAPKVDSAVLKMKVLDEPRVKVKDEKYFTLLVKTGFNQRRKILKNALLRMGLSGETVKKAYAELKINPLVRAEELSIEKFAELSDYLTKK